jgi:putative flippase GtrA
MLRYSAASAVAVVIGVVLLALLNGPLGMSAWVASTIGTAVAAWPSYYLNRKWAWGMEGRSHLLKEVVPFWILAFVGWAFSTEAVHLMENYAKEHRFSHLSRTGSVLIIYVTAIGVLWVVKFVIFNKLMFVHREDSVAEVAI